MDNFLELGQQVLASQPFSSLLGTKITVFSPEGVELVLPITAQLTQQHGFLHGGVVSYLADNALTFAGGSALGPAVVTLEYKINYLRPATGNFLIARANPVYIGKNHVVCRCEVFITDDKNEERLCAVAQGTISQLGQPSS